MTIHQKRQISSSSQPHQHLTLEPKISRLKHNAQLLVCSLYTRTHSAQLESLLLFCMSEHLTNVHQDSLGTDSCDSNYCFALKWTSANTSSPSLSHPVKSTVAGTDQPSSSLSHPVKVLLVVQIILHHHYPTQLKPGQTSIAIDRHCLYVYRTVLHHHWKLSWSVCHHHHYNDKSF